MKKRFSTVVMSCFLSAVFVGSAEAKTIDNYGADSGLSRFAATAGSPGIFGDEMAKSGWSEWPMGGPGAGIDGLLAFYYGIEAWDQETDSEKNRKSLVEIQMGEGDEESYLNERYWSDVPAAFYAGPLVAQALAAPTIHPQQTASPPAASDKIPAARQQPRTSLQYSFSQPPIITVTQGPAQNPVPSSPKKEKKEPKEDPAIANNPPADDLNRPEPTKEKPENPKDFKLPESKPTVADASDEGKKDHRDKQSNHGQDKVDPSGKTKVEVQTTGLILTQPALTPVVATRDNPAGFNIIQNAPVDSPAPVPEPATMLLFSTGLAGFAVSWLRKGKNCEGNGI